MDDRTLIIALNAMSQLARVDPSDGGPYDVAERDLIVEAAGKIAEELDRRGYEVQVGKLTDHMGRWVSYYVPLTR
jgi:hypothetical protein